MFALSFKTMPIFGHSKKNLKCAQGSLNICLIILKFKRIIKKTYLYMYVSEYKSIGI